MAFRVFDDVRRSVAGAADTVTAELPAVAEAFRRTSALVTLCLVGIAVLALVVVVRS